MRTEWKNCKCGCGARTRYIYLKGHRTIKHQILEKVQIDNESDCWIWPNNIFNNGYGAIGIIINGVRKWKPVHRVAFEVFKSPIQERMFVLHKCDNKRCVNPEHLHLGTQQDNMNDMVQRGRSLKGEINPQAILTKEQAIEVKYGNTPTRVLTKKFGVHRDTIRSIRKGINWSWL